MAEVTVLVNGRPYTVGCEDGQEGHLRELAAVLDENVRQVAGAVGPLGETRLFLMGALMMADELSDLRARLAETESELARRQAAKARDEMRAVTAIEAAAKKIEALAAKA
ncbi:MAG: cell division protein ZapA [Acetobacteraceae bacterium]|nr:cell division protein ZapA [Acetobacteraceae bacterium]